MNYNKKQFCLDGHDTFVVGRNSRHVCNACGNRRNKEMQWKNWGVTNPDGTPFLINDFNRTFQIQGGRCANKACNKHQSELKRSLLVDHDHKTGFFRGLLCQYCNVALGLVKDNPAILDGLKEFLQGK